jgi:hypothetical protein
MLRTSAKALPPLVLVADLIRGLYSFVAESFLGLLELTQEEQRFPQ